MDRIKDTQLSRAEDRLPLPAGAKRLIGLSYASHWGSVGSYVVHCYEGPMGRVFFGLWAYDPAGDSYRVATDSDTGALSDGRLRELCERGRTMAQKYQALYDADLYLDRGNYMDSADPATLGKLRRGDDKAFASFNRLAEVA